MNIKSNLSLDPFSDMSPNHDGCDFTSVIILIEWWEILHLEYFQLLVDIFFEN